MLTCAVSGFVCRGNRIMFGQCLSILIEISDPYPMDAAAAADWVGGLKSCAFFLAGEACAEAECRPDSSFSHIIVIISNKVCRTLILGLTEQGRGVK